MPTILSPMTAAVAKANPTTMNKSPRAKLLNLSPLRVPATLLTDTTWGLHPALGRRQEFCFSTSGFSPGRYLLFVDTFGQGRTSADGWAALSRKDVTNTNGLLRQYFTKGTELSRHSSGDLDAVALVLNARARKMLRWKTPAEALAELLSSDQREE